MQTLESKDLKTSYDANENKILPSSSSSSSITLNKIFSKEEEIEANKDKLDLKPNIDFVSKNIKEFEAGLNEILQRKSYEDAETWSQQISFTGAEDIVDPQVSPEDCKEILARMPKSLVELSKLQTVDYHLFSSDKHLLPIPGYNENGSLNTSKVCAIEVKNFPRKKDDKYIGYRFRKNNGKTEFIGEDEIVSEDDHPSRILVGVSIGDKIFPTPIPKTVSEDERATYLYQVHVLLHEFFHTIDYPRRNPEERAKIILKVDGQQFTFQDWWTDFEELILSGNEPGCISSYANTYFDDLNEKTKKEDYNKFTIAIAEQICETFVAYQLGIISNNKGWINFKEESFDNISQFTKFTKQESQSANSKWILMDKLCRASVVKQNEKEEILR